jgi:hypothetical protein
LLLNRLSAMQAEKGEAIAALEAAVSQLMS